MLSGSKYFRFIFEPSFYVMRAGPPIPGGHRLAHDIGPLGHGKEKTPSVKRNLCGAYVVTHVLAGFRFPELAA